LVVATPQFTRVQLRGAQTGPIAGVAWDLLRSLGRSAGLIEEAWQRTVRAAANAGVPLEEVAQWTGFPAGALRELLAGQEDDGGRDWQ
jgi:hypothetical protein